MNRPDHVRAPILALIAAPVLASAQGRPVRIPVHHADAWAIKAMMEGRPIVSPEISTILGLMGGPAAAAAGASVSNLLLGGRLFVDPTDNALWWVP